MSQANVSSMIELQIRQFQNFMGFTLAYLRKNNPVKLILEGTVAYFQELFSMNKKLIRIQNRINYERYKLKKTELILAQNSEHVFLKGRQINQTR